MTDTLLLHLDGADVPAAEGATFELRNPATGELLYHVAHAGPADVDAAVRSARVAFDDRRWRGQQPRTRARVLSRAAQLLAERIDDWARLETLQIGRPLREMQAQLARLPEWLEYFGQVAATAEGTVPDVGPQHLNIVRRGPLGVGALITPWNHPLLITMKKLSAALAAGNSLVVKPSELGPAVPLALASLLEEAGVPPGVINVVTGYGATTGRALTEHRGVDKIDFTGGTETGRAIAAAGGGALVPVVAELGGKAPVVILDDADLDRAVSGALFASFVATGQTCVQGARILVHERIAGAFTEQFLARAAALRLGSPLDLTTQVGPLVSEAQRTKTAAAVDLARQQGARVLVGGAIPPDPHLADGWFYAPTVIGDVTADHDIWSDEVFGPVTVLRTFHDDDEAVQQANDSPFGLAASVWTGDTTRALRMIERLEIGIIWVNDHHRIDPASPWGGFKDSGIGSENGLEAYRAWTHQQSVLINVNPEPFDWFGSTRAMRYS
jgi:phenylacetaldehyde dehydrogenase